MAILERYLELRVRGIVEAHHLRRRHRRINLPMTWQAMTWQAMA